MLCYHKVKVDINGNVHFRISLHETLIFLSRTSLRECRSSRSLNLSLAWEWSKTSWLCSIAELNLIKSLTEPRFLPTNTFNIFNAKALFPISTTLTKIFLLTKLPPLIISIISIEQKDMSKGRAVFFIRTVYQNGWRTTRKIFSSGRQIWRLRQSSIYGNRVRASKRIGNSWAI